MGLTTDEEINEILTDYMESDDRAIAVLRIKLLISESIVATLKRIEGNTGS